MTARKRRSLGDVLAQTAPEEQEPGPAAPPPAVATTPRKFTMLMSDDEVSRANTVVDAVVARSGIRTTKSMRADVVRALFAEAAVDQQLQERLAARVRRAVEES